MFVAIFLLAGTHTLMSEGLDDPWLGILWTKGGVSVGGASVSSGTTVLPGDVITTSAGASAWVRFRSPASTILLTETQVVLLASDSAPSFMLRRGTVVVDEKVVDPVQVAVPGGYVLVEGDPRTGAECEMVAVHNSVTVSVKRGLAEIHSLGEPVILHAGQSAQVASGKQGDPQVAGHINRVIPQGKIQRQGQAQELPLTLHEVVNWNDLVRTLQMGRAQIVLVDGSTLNVGARSEIRILKHVPEKQQTEIELTSGQVQANVRKITTPGGKFELHTKSAVIGTVDTSYVAVTDDKSTKVCGVKGTTAVKSSDPNIHKTVKLHKNECTIVWFGLPPADPVLAPAEAASMLGQTAVAGGLGPAAIAGIAAGAGGVGGGIAAVVLASPGATTPTTP
jgi:ferric-dicitrate binding protein FerR (iron transport regulator)